MPRKRATGNRGNQIKEAVDNIQFLTQFYLTIGEELMRKSEKLAIFMDAGYVYEGAQKVGIEKPDYIQLIEALREGRYLVRAYYYNGIYPEWAAKNDPEIRKLRDYAERFKKIFRDKPIKAIYVEMKKRDDKWIQKGVDVQMATDILSLAHRDAYSVALLVTGDGDFAPVIREVQSYGKRAELACFRYAVSGELLDLVDRVIYMDDMIKPYEW